MATYYVSTTGNNNSDGSESSPFRTINHAVNSGLQPGDEVIVKPGTYRESVYVGIDGSAAGDITIRSEVPGAAAVAPGSSGNGFTIEGNYITIDGFEIYGSAYHGIEAQNSHHVSMLNNISHDNGASGLSAIYGEFYVIEGNSTYGNASSGWFSGISVYENRNISGDTSTPGYRTIIRDNISYDNVTEGGLHTDGNGIIIDDFQHTQNGGYPSYTYPTLVENNLVYLNGGKGIQVTWSDNVTVRGNTAWHNNQDLQNDGTWRGEISNSQSSNNTFVNNIAVADPNVHSDNRALDNTSYGGYRNENVVWANNLTYNGIDGQASVRTDGNNPMPSAADGNLLGINPDFIGAPGNFQLSPDSPAIDAGTSDYGLPANDLDGGTRTNGVVDIGAYESGTGGPTTPPPANSAPDAINDTGLSTTEDTAVTISADALLANDVDADGDALTITGVGGAQNGTVTLNGQTIVFTPAGGHTGPARFDYTVSDGRGGTDTARVSLTVEPGTDTDPQPDPDPEPPVDTSGMFSIWEDSQRPATFAENDGRAVTLGLEFTADVDAELIALEIHVSPENAGMQSIALWSDDGSVLARTNANVSGTGWQTIEFDAPVELEAGEQYVASYYTPDGNYSVSQGFFGAAVDVGPISLGANAGVFSYGTGSSFPTQTYMGSNYWVDVVIDTDPDTDPDTNPGTDPDDGGDPDQPETIGVIGEAGVVVQDQSGAGQWHRVEFDTALDDPSVVMGGFSGNGSAPYTVQLRNVSSTGFEFQIDEWDYLDGSHEAESISWLAIEAGTHRLADGRVISAGDASVGDGFERIGFGDGMFDSAPVVLGQSVGTGNSMAVTDRIQSVSSTGFEASLFQQEARAGAIASQDFDWIAIEQGGSASTGALAGTTGLAVGHRATEIDFEGSFDTGDFAFLTDIQTGRGLDTATLQTVAIDTDTVVLRVLEEQSRDGETWHLREDAGFAGFELGAIEGLSVTDDFLL